MSDYGYVSFPEKALMYWQSLSDFSQTIIKISTAFLLCFFLFVFVSAFIFEHIKSERRKGRENRR